MEPTISSTMTVRIVYCVGCRWITRASWLAQELLLTFGHSLKEVALVPGGSGIFEVHLDQTCIFSRAESGRFPEPKELKQIIRNQIDPTRSLGHSDRP